MQTIELMIIGTQKAGTSALNRYLGEHPDIMTHNNSEMSFFKFKKIYNQGIGVYLKKHYQAPSKKIIIGKNVAIFEDEEAIKRMKEHNPNMKIVIILRNPVERAYSAYKYALRCAYEPLDSFKKALEEEENRLEEDFFKWRNTAYKYKGEYHKHLTIIYKYFKKEQVKVLIFEEFVRNPLPHIKEIHNWLNLSHYIPNFNKKHNVSKVPRFKILAFLQYSDNSLKKLLKKIISKEKRKNISKKIENLNLKDSSKDKIDKEIELELYEYFKKSNEKLEILLERDLKIWNK